MINQHQTIKDNIKRLNQPFPLIPELVALIGDKKEVLIADLGSGPMSTIGHYFDGVKVTVLPSDKQDFSEFWMKYNVLPRVPVFYEDMEKLTYLDNTFDIVHSENALDHTRKAQDAIKEMIRVCKPGGWVYIKCNLMQKDTGGHHYWNAHENGILEDGVTTFDLKEYGFVIKYIDNGGEPRYNQIIAILQKP